MISVFAVSALLSLLSHLSYKSALDGARKFVFGLILLSVTVAPAVKAITGLSDFDVKDIISDKKSESADASELYEGAFCEGISNAVCEKFELKFSDVTVLIEGFSGSEWKCDNIRIILSGTAAFADSSGIERYINRLDIGDCEVEIEIG